MNSDKIADLLKEFNISMMSNDKTSADALKAL
jgi:hypothetical protein